MSFLKRKIDNRELNPIGLGCMSLSQAYHPIPNEDDGERLLNHALDIGVDHFDTARLYGLGHNEALLSRVLKTRRNEVFLATKAGIEASGPKRYIDCSPNTLRKAVDTSLSVLGVEYIDLYYMHRRDFNVPIEESVGAMAELVKAGKIGGIGLSEMSEETLRRANSEYQISALQTEYSLWTRNPEIGVLDACAELNIAFVAFSPVARGALAAGVKDPSNLAENDLRKNHPRFTSEYWPENAKLIKAFDVLAEQAGVTSAQLSLAWVLSRGDHIHVIPGTGKIAHLEENNRTSQLAIEPEYLERAGKLINQQTVCGHRYPEGMRQTIDTEEFPQSE